MIRYHIQRFVSFKMDSSRRILPPCNISRVFRLLIVLSTLSAIFFIFHNVKRRTSPRLPAAGLHSLEQDPFVKNVLENGKRLKDPIRPIQGGAEYGSGGGNNQQSNNTLSADGDRVLYRFSGMAAEIRLNTNTSDHALVVEGLKRNIEKLRKEGGTLIRDAEEYYRNSHLLHSGNADAKGIVDQVNNATNTGELRKEIKYGNVAVDRDDEHASSEDVQKRPIFVVIVARMRTGSSFMGEIFNQNPTLFYIYEPLMSIDMAIRGGWAQPEQHRAIGSYLFHEFSQCRFPNPLTRMWLSWMGGTSRSVKIKERCSRSQLAFWSAKTQGFIKRDCNNISVESMESICTSTSSRIVIKTIRSDLDYLKPLIDAGIDVKIIHLVRDPRGTANSRRLYYLFNRPNLPFRGEKVAGKSLPKGKLNALGLLGNYSDHVVHTIPRLCQWTRDSLLQVKEKPSWLRGRYKLVRYEDFAMDPLGTAWDIYDFIGIEYPLSVRKWLVANTGSDDMRSTKLFSVHKNSTSTASRWRSTLRMPYVRQVENVCTEAMEMLGYRRVSGRDELLNDSIPLTGPLPMDDEF